MKNFLLIIAIILLVAESFAGETLPNKNNPLFEASKEGNLSDFKSILSKGVKDDGTALVVSSQNGHIEVVKLLLENNPQTKSKRAALFLASERGHIEIAKLLIDYGAEVNSIDKNDLTLLYHASSAGHADIVKLLIDNGAKVNVIMHKNHLTALIVASLKGHTEVAKILLQNGAEVNVKTADKGATPLILSSLRGHTEVVKVLLENGADVNVRQKGTGVTALFLASMEGHSEIVKLLIASGAGVNAKEYGMGITPLWIASMNGHTGVVKLLLDNGADLSDGGEDMTPLDIATEKGHTQIIELLNNAIAQRKSSGFDTTREKSTQLPTDSLIENKLLLVNYYFKRGGFKIELPKNWKNEEEDADKDVWVLSATSPDDSLKDSFLENINIVIMPADTSNLEEAVKRGIKSLEQNTLRFQLIDQGIEKKGLNDVAWIIYTYENNGFTLKVLNVAIIKGNRLYIATCTALETTYDKYQPIFDQIVSSIKFDETAIGTSIPLEKTDNNVHSGAYIGYKFGILIGGLAGAFFFVRRFLVVKKK